VQGTLHTDSGVLEASHMDDAGHLVPLESIEQEGAVKDRPLHESDIVRHELRMPTREVIEDNRSETGILKRTHHMGSDIAGAAGH
jgi:predicted component of type VI protein secretion system